MRAQLLSHHRHHSLRWHLTAVLLIKAAALYLIWLAWFSQPVSLEPQDVAEALLTPSPVLNCNRQDACDVAQP